MLVAEHEQTVPSDRLFDRLWPHLVAQGESNRDIAERLVISPLTVNSHLYRVFGKLGVKSRSQAAVRARELRIV